MRARASFLACLLLSVLAGVIPAGAQTTLFSDDFGPKPLASWEPSPLGLLGNWSAGSGAAEYNGGGHTQLVAGDPGWTDYRIEAKFRLDNGNNHPGGLRGRVDVTTGQSYAAWLYPGSGVIKLFRVAAWHIDTAGLTLIAEAPASLASGVFHTLALDFQGSQISVVYDGSTVIQETDSTLAAGAVALDVSNQPIAFDDVLVTAGSTTLFSDDFSPRPLRNWTASPLGLANNWDASSGAAAYNGGGHTQLWAGEPGWTDYTVEAKVKVTNAGDYPGGLRGRLNPATGGSYAAWIYPGQGKIKLWRHSVWHIDTPPTVALAEANVSIATGTAHALAIRFQGSRITVSFNGVDVIDLTDTAIASGAIALDVSNQPVEFDDVTVTQPAAGEDNGPGGPVLVISKEGNPFTRYYGEILLAEGLSHFAVREIDTVTSTVLANYDVAILGEMTLTSGQVAMLSDWVEDGGNLVAMRPDPQLAGLLGITPASGTLSEGYLLATGQGIVDQTIQYHGTADRYTLNGATAVATLYSDATTATSNPAVTVRSVGSLGGQAAAFTYDLARSIVLTRQGNPAWAGQERDAQPPRRPNDLFYGNASFDPQPDWIDLDKVAIPQADEQQRLLANLILGMAADRKPLPRFWYFPRGEKAVVVMTGDDHGNNGTLGRFQGFDLASPVSCSVEDWECVRGTSYIYPNTPLAPVDAEAFEADGFEVAVHVNTGCADWTPSSLETFFTAQIADFAARYTTIDAPATNRTHCIVWSDWVTQARVQEDLGIRLDTNYYFWPPAWVDDRPGFMTGSGMPMRFADTDGTRIDVYQAATQMTDESGQTYPFTIDTLLDNALGSPGFYGAMTANMHTDSTGSSGSDAIVASALTRGVPVVTARQMLTWLDGRNGSKFGSIAWSGNTLTFTVTAAQGSNGLRAMIPATTSAGTLASLTAGGSPVTWTTETIKGIAYAIFPAVSGAYTATYAP